MPSEVFFTMAISAGVALISRAVEGRSRFISLHPFRIVLAAELEGILRKVLAWLRRRAGTTARRPRGSDKRGAR